MITSALTDESFDYQATAELFSGRNIRVRSRVLKYVRFAVRQRQFVSLLGNFQPMFSWEPI
jgi:hypothetical protein